MTEADDTTDSTARIVAPLMVEYATAVAKPAELTDGQRAMMTVAAYMGALPLTLGCLDFLLWVPTRAQIFVVCGLLIVQLGIVCTCIGMLMLLVCLCSLRGTGRVSVFFSSSRIALLLLIVNYPIAFGIILLVGSLGGP
jgi:hypothetical protein